MKEDEISDLLCPECNCNLHYRQYMFTSSCFYCSNKKCPIHGYWRKYNALYIWKFPNEETIEFCKGNIETCFRIYKNMKAFI